MGDEKEVREELKSVLFLSVRMKSLIQQTGSHPCSIIIITQKCLIIDDSGHEEKSSFHIYIQNIYWKLLMTSGT